MPDIRSFFAPKGGAAPKPAAPKPEPPAKAKRGSESRFEHSCYQLMLTIVSEGRKVIEDSDDDEVVE